MLGNIIEVKVERIGKDKVKIAIDAPRGLQIDRKERYKAPSRQKSPPGDSG